MKAINIIIDDDNSYFSAGLQSSINEYAKTNNKAICFLKQGAAVRPDVMFISSRRIAQRWRRAAYDEGGPPVVTIEDRPVTAHEAFCVLYRTDSPEKLFKLLADTLGNTRIADRFEYQPFTRRERQVVNYLRRGFDQSQTARVLGVSVKTVHSHKRAVMKKLMLSRHHDFIYWLLSQEGECS
ncbi:MULTISPECIES: LuxR C-terminal-related transcriptional regulator [Serratia]|uniref:LuxR C-terminal-related transcriptional regulator n=1 Tax=Serratia TaxID=613 RepID=UPI0007C8D6D3|nr:MULTISPECIES: LuxR C-terminal-related transcriptional regulator [Serratia]MDH2267789.1 LuxR C-terminal-related transcriptional regulator [Serratia marcescens]MDH2275766.1 LuxR C-terminal-related transcriptional regulator [Serratia marcescens]OAH32987.1 helix-turn-helix transcriptional regulator [Serratia marcescens]PTA78986.1 DNA-binding response regulator [Serratia sp. Nf2]